MHTLWQKLWRWLCAQWQLIGAQERQRAHDLQAAQRALQQLTNSHPELAADPRLRQAKNQVADALTTTQAEADKFEWLGGLADPPNRER